jgi:uncharacterized protein with HEPN domain
VSREVDLWLEDILESGRLVSGWTRGLGPAEFRADRRTVDAVLRNLEVIGEAVKHVPEELRNREPSVPWRRIAGLRDVLAHAYFAVDLDLIWDVVANHLEPLLEAASRLRGEAGGDDRV